MGGLPERNPPWTAAPGEKHPPPDRNTPWTETPQIETPQTENPWTETPPSVDRQTPVKTLPSETSFAGGNDI